MAQTNTTKPKRRTYSKELKAYLVEQALTGKRSIANLAQGHGINPNLLQKWIKSVRDEKIAATLSQPLASSNIETNLIDHGSEPAFLPVILQHKTKHEITPQATAFAPTLTGIQLQIPKHNGTPITLSIAQIDTHSLIELLRGLLLTCHNILGKPALLKCYSPNICVWVATYFILVSLRCCLGICLGC